MPKVSEREVRYPKHQSKIGWLSGEQAKKLLDWQQPPEGKTFSEFLLKDCNDVPTKCLNVEKQRPFYANVAKQWMGEILGQHWNGDGGETNGEAMIIGRTGLVIDGKHRLIGLVLACQEWLLNPGKYPWAEEPKMHCWINFGVREDIHSINTINTGKPRSLGDAIFASGLFGEFDPSKGKDRRSIKILSKIADHAIRLLWHRTGACDNAFAPRRSHAESLDFIERHPKILECVKHIHEENGNDNKLKYYPGPGQAAALMYLMGSCKTQRDNEEGTGYAQVDYPTESLLDWSMWDKACEFWTSLADIKNGSLNELREAIGGILNAEEGTRIAERTALVVKAWGCFAHDEKVTKRALELEYEVDRNGFERLAECPTCGNAGLGIDLGDPGDNRA